MIHSWYQLQTKIIDIKENANNGFARIRELGNADGTDLRRTRISSNKPNKKSKSEPNTVTNLEKKVCTSVCSDATASRPKEITNRR